MRKVIAVAVTVLLLAGAAQAADLSYVDRTVGSGASEKTFVDITAKEGTDTIWTMTVNLGRADNHQYWTRGEIASFQDTSWGGTAFEYSPEGGTAGSSGLYKGARLSGTFAEGARTAASYMFTYSGTITDGEGDTADYTYTTTILAPTSVTSLGGGRYSYQTVLQTAIQIVHTGGGGVDLDGTQNNASLAVNNDGLTGWTILNPIVSGQPFPNVHANDSTDGHQLYDLVDWYGTTTGDHNDGFQVDFTVKDNADTASANMRPGLDFELVNSDISLNYANRANNNIGRTLNSGNDDLHGYLFNDREAYNDGADLSAAGSWNGTSALTITAPIPEPATMALLGLGLIGLIIRRKK